MEISEIAVIADALDAVALDRRPDHARPRRRARHCYDRETVRINANVAPATHGETVREILGSGDASHALPGFR